MDPKDQTEHIESTVTCEAISGGCMVM
ncbi:hypothetical protein VTN49DRAFT_1332 [Thermomyces lanuginosus]